MKDFSEIRQSLDEEILEENLQDPPTLVVLRRTAIRLFPGNQRVALYRNDHLGLEVSIPYEQGHIGGKKITAMMKEETHHENLLGVYFNALHHGAHDRVKTYHKDATKRFGSLAASHLHNTAANLVAGEHDKANKHWNRFLRNVNEQKEPIVERAIHSIHRIARTGQDGDVSFGNGKTARVSGKQAIAVIKAHSALTPENKKKLEDLVHGGPDGMKKIVDFAQENLK